MGKHIIYIRHGHTDVSDVKTKMSTASSQPLSSKGRQQAADLYTEYGSVVDRVFCSPAERCRQTAAAFGHSMKIIDDLAEMSTGCYEGVHVHDMPATLVANIARRNSSPDYLAGQWTEDLIECERQIAEEMQGETYQDFARRVIDTHNRIVAEIGGNETVVVVTHNGFIRVLIGILNQIWYTTLAKSPPAHITHWTEEEGILPGYMRNL